MRLIDADRLKRVLIAFFTGAHSELSHISKVIDFLDAAPTINAVEVIRCNDCRHCLPYNNINYCSHYPYRECYVVVEKNDYCSYGERKEE